MPWQPEHGVEVDVTGSKYERRGGGGERNGGLGIGMGCVHRRRRQRSGRCWSLVKKGLVGAVSGAAEVSSSRVLEGVGSVSVFLFEW